MSDALELSSTINRGGSSRRKASLEEFQVEQKGWILSLYYIWSLSGSYSGNSTQSPNTYWRCWTFCTWNQPTAFLAAGQLVLFGRGSMWHTVWLLNSQSHVSIAEGKNSGLGREPPCTETLFLVLSILSWNPCDFLRLPPDVQVSIKYS